MTEVCRGWYRGKLGDLVDYGATEKIEPSKIPRDAWVLELEDIERDTSRIISRKTAAQRKPKSTKNRFRAGDVLYGKLRPYLNKVVLADRDGFSTTEIVPLNAHGYAEQRFLFYWLKSTEFREYANSVSHGINMPRLGTEAGSAAPLVLAPLAEQRRLADRLDSLIAHADMCRVRLDRLLQIIKRLRQSVLVAATSGKLTEEWRQRHPTESGKALLERIVAARLLSAQSESHRRRIEELTDAVAGVEGNGNWFPSSWVSCTIGSIGDVCNGSTPSRKEAGYWRGTIPWVSSGEVQNCEIFETRERISQQGFENSSVRLLPEGTVLVAMIGEGKTRGQSAILRVGACINQNIAGVVIDHGLVEPKFLFYWLQARYEANREVGSGSGPQALNCQRVRELPVSLPPLGEQIAIARRVDLLLSNVDKLMSQVASARARVDSFMPAILAKAFRGELLPQDPNDEPASVLLQRLRGERQGHTESRGRSRPQSTSNRTSVALADGKAGSARHLSLSGE